MKIRNTNINLLSASSLAFATLFALLNGAGGATITWTNTAGGNWSDANNWSPNRVPNSNWSPSGQTSTNDVLITTPGTYTVVVDTPVIIANLTLGTGGGGSGVQSLQVTTAATYLDVTNSLLVTDGGALTTGADSTSVGAVTMTVANGGVAVVNAGHEDFDLGANLVVTNGGVVYANYYPFAGCCTDASTFGGPVRVENGGVLVANGIYVGGFAGSWFSIGHGGVLTGSGIFAALTNAGLINLTNTSISAGLLNQPDGVVHLAGGAKFSGAYFTNLGIVMASGTNPNTINVADFENGQGTVTNLSGALLVGTFLTNLTGTYYAAAGATNQFAAINDGVNFATAGAPLVLAGPGQFQFNSGDLYLPTNVFPNLALCGGQLKLGAGFQGGAITNLALSGVTLWSNSLPITGNFSAFGNCAIAGDSVVAGGGRFTAVNFLSLAPIRVNSGGTFTASEFTNTAPLLVAAGGVANLAADISLYAPCTNSGSINLSNATVSVINNLGYNLGSIINLAGGAMNFLGGGSSIFYNNGPEPFINHGSLVFNSPSGTNFITFLNLDLSQGMVTNLAGTAILRVYQTNLAGTYYSAAGAVIQFKNSDVDFVNNYDFNSVTNFATPGTPFVLNGGGQFQFAGGNLYLPANVPPHLSLVGGILKLGPNFQGGAITNLTFAGFLLTNPISAAFPITGTLTLSNCGGIVPRYISYNQMLPTGVWGNFTVAGGGQLNVYASDLHGAVTVANGGLMTVVHGGMTVEPEGSLTVANGGRLNLTATGASLYGPLTNAGTINVTNPPGGFPAGLAFNNDGTTNYRGGAINQPSGLINLAGDYTELFAVGGGYEYLVNQGRIIKSAGTNYSLLLVPCITNSGAITVQSGIMAMRPFVTQAGGSLNVVLNSATDYGSFIATSAGANPPTGTQTLAGAFNATLANGYLPANGTAFNVFSYGAFTGTFASLGLPSAASWQPTYGSTNFSLVVGSAKPRFGTYNVSGTNLVFSGLGGSPGSNYIILVSTNLTLPLGSWSSVTTNTFDGGGQFHYTNPVSRAKPRQFFIFKLR